MLITTNDGIKTIAEPVVLGEYGIEMLGAALPVETPELDELGIATVDNTATTYAKPIIKMLENGCPIR